MPIIVVGADTPFGIPITSALTAAGGEVRVFATDQSAADSLRTAGVKTAVGDVSDSSHVEAAALGCFAAILLADAATDDRERAFADDPETVYSGWMAAIVEAGIHRVIWVADRDRALPRGSIPESALVLTMDRSINDIVAEVVRLEEAEELG
jgi:nucleoside-diphosphate-sugar epimerase